MILAAAAYASGERSPVQHPAVESPDGERPNVVLILVDDMGYDDYGMAGNPFVRTPALDAFAARSVRWDPFYVSPVCGLTRAALISGRYPHRVGVASNGMDMRADAVTVAEVMQEAGYATAIFGKWHLGDHFPARPMDQGFEESLLARGGVIGQLASAPPMGQYTDPVLEHNGVRAEYTGYATDIYFDAALAWMAQSHDEGRNFFAYISTNAPHRPLDDVPSPEYEHYRDALITNADVELTQGDEQRLDRNARVYAMIERIDTNVGRLFDGLGEMGVLDDTLVMFLSDNGPTGGRFSNGFTGGKASMREGGLRTRFFAQWPGELVPGERTGRPAAHIDLMPTLMEACGIAHPEGWKSDGRSMLSVLRNDTGDWPDRNLYFEAHQGTSDPRANFAIRTSEWKLIRGGGYRSGGALAAPQLYDIGADPLEQHDVAQDHTELVDGFVVEFEEIAREIEVAGGARVPRIQLGHPREAPLFLSRVNWARAAVTPEDATWKLYASEEAGYIVRLFFAPSDERRQASIWISGGRGIAKKKDMKVPKGATSCVFKRVKFKKGKLDFSASVGSAPYPTTPVWQAEITRR